MSENQREKGWGRKLRRARNVVKRFEAAGHANDLKFLERYNRAKAILLAEKLQAS